MVMGAVAALPFSASQVEVVDALSFKYSSQSPCEILSYQALDEGGPSAGYGGTDDASGP